MATYRSYFLDYQEHIEAAESIEADRVDEAIDRALAILKARPRHHSVEVWRGARRLYSSRKRTETAD